jgi:polysaccharide deacetylase family protein (PEP-CTERM system associated)
MNILTFDIEEWFHCDFISDSSTWTNYEVRIHKNTDLILETLDKRNIKGTFFILGWVAAKYPEVVRKINSLGHEIGCHSYLHDLVHNMDIQTFRKDTDYCLKLLEDITGKKVTAYRAPGFSIGEKNKWAFEVLAELGIETDCSVFSAEHDYGGFPSFGECLPSILDIKGYKLKEFPMNTVSFFNKNVVFSGGGYFRIIPYVLIKYWTKRSDYVMSYFHPRDFDFNQPKLTHLPLARKFKSYVGLKTAYPKFLKWLTDFEVMSLGEASEVVDWSKANIISISF